MLRNATASTDDYFVSTSLCRIYVAVEEIIVKLLIFALPKANTFFVLFNPFLKGIQRL